MKHLIAALALIVSTSAFAEMGYLVTQYQGQSVTGKYGTVCVYRFSAGNANVFIGQGFCPLSWTIN